MDGQAGRVSQTEERRSWQADRQSAWYACITLPVFWGGFSPWCSTSFGSVNSSRAVLVSTGLAHSSVRRSWRLVSERTNGNLSTRRQEGICISTLQECHVSAVSMFKEERGELHWFIFHSTMHSLASFDAILNTFSPLLFYRLGHDRMSIKMSNNIFLSFPFFYTFQHNIRQG